MTVDENVKTVTGLTRRARGLSHPAAFPPYGEDTMDVNTIGIRRLVTHRLGGTPCATPEDVVRWMGALQAQA